MPLPHVNTINTASSQLIPKNNTKLLRFVLSNFFLIIVRGVATVQKKRKTRGLAEVFQKKKTHGE